MKFEKNVLGTNLEVCCVSPRTGYFRTGYCRSDETDEGNHSVCVLVDDAFLMYSLEHGNDLITPHPEFDFPGLRPGDKWCVCAARWKEANDAGQGGRIVLESTHSRSLEVVTLEELKKAAQGQNLH